MTWLRIDDGFNENPKIEKLRDRAFRLHVAGLVYCAKNLTDGYLSEKSLKVVAILVSFPAKRHIVELVDARLWSPDETDGYWINDYLVYNPDSESVKRVREERSEAGKAGAAKRWANTKRYGNSQWQESKQTPMAPVDAPVPVPALPRNFLKAVTADQEIEHEIDKLMRCLKGADDGSRGVITSIARKLPVSRVAKVRESCQGRTVGAGYAVRALQAELADIEDVA